MNKKIIFFVAISFFILIFVGVWWWQNIRTQTIKHTGPLTKVTLQVKWTHQAQFAGFYAAVKEGFYKDEGLDVTILPVGEDLSEKTIIDKVNKGNIQFGLVGADQVIFAREENKNVKALSVIYQQSPVVIAALQNSGIKEPKDLIGKKMAVEKGQNTDTIYRAIMKKAGIDTSKVKEVTAPVGLGALSQGLADARMIYTINEGVEPQEGGSALNIIYPEDYNIQFYADTLITSDALINQNPDLVKRFVRASLKGWNWAVINPEKAGSLALLYDPTLSSKHQIDMIQASLPLIYTGKTAIGNMDPSIWNNMQNILFEQGLIKEHIPLDNIFTTKFLNQ